MFFIKKFDELVFKDELVVTDIDFVLRKNICQEHQIKEWHFLHQKLHNQQRSD